jgi:peptidoglycan hydrolase-like protein with peptidoglycan-binding domain
MKELDAKLAKEANGQTGAEAVAKTSVVPAAERAQASTVARGVSPVFNKDLIRGARGDDVKRLQALLEVEQSGLFGTATEKTLKAFQLKHGIIRSEKSTGAGKLGPATRAKLKEVFGERATMPEATATPSVIPSPTSPSSSGPAPALTRTLGSGSRGDDVKALQSFLGVEATGHFGSQTKAAIVKFQLTHGIVHGASDPGYGKVGPKTRAKLMEVGNASASAGSPVESTTRPSGSEQGGKALEKQLEDALTQLRALQADLKKAQ